MNAIIYYLNFALYNSRLLAVFISKEFYSYAKPYFFKKGVSTRLQVIFE